MSYTLAYTGTQIDDILGRAAPNGEFDGYFADINDKLDKLNIVTTSDDYATVQAYVQNNVAVALSDGGKFYVYTGEYDGNYYFACVTQGSSDTTDAVFEVAYIDSGNNWSVGGWSALAPVFSPNFTGNPTAPTPTQSSNNTKIATTAFVHTAVDPVSSAALNAYPTDTASGDVVSFPDGADDIPVKAFTGSIVPIQDLNGQSAPYPAGGNKNKFDADTAYSALKTATNTYVGTGGQFNGINVNVPDSLIGVECTFSAYLSPASGASNVRVVAKVDGVDVRGDSIQGGASGYSAVTFTPTAGTTLRISYGSGGSLSITVKDVQLETGSSRTAYAPYANICPISGWTGANITRAGKNILDMTVGSWSSGIIAADGTITPNGAYHYMTDSRPIKGGTDYAFGVTKDTSSAVGFAVSFYDEDDNFISTNVVVPAATTTGRRTATFTTPSGTARYRLRCPVESPQITSYQIEEGSSATAYEAYNGSTILLSFGETVYAGTLTALGGGLWKIQPTHKIDALDSHTWNYGGNNRFNATGFSDMKQDGLRSEYIYCSCYAPNVGGGAYDPFTIYNGTGGYLYVVDDRTTDGATLKTLLAGQKMVYPLATLPDQIIVSGEDLQTLLGANTVWLDCGAVNSLEYRADTALYIDKKLGA